MIASWLLDSNVGLAFLVVTYLLALVAAPEK